MRIALDSLGKRWLFFAVALLAANGFCFEAGRVELASLLSNSSKAEHWLRAAELDPGNAAYWHALGLFEEWDLDGGDLARAVSYYERASQLNPGYDIYWLDLAGSLENLGEVESARKAFEQAKAAHPASSEVAWRYGNFLLRRGYLSAAYVEIRRALATDPRLTVSAISQCWKSQPSVDALVNAVLPPDLRFYLPALDYLVSEHEGDAALVLWNKLLLRKQPVDVTQAVPLVNELVRENRVSDAQGAWQQALEAGGRAHDEAASSLVFNGGFEEDPVHGGFDWQFLAVEGASFDVDTTEAHSGRRSLRITFDGEANPNFAHVFQWVAVEPHRRYRLVAFLRTEAISTDSGIRFMISDYYRPEAFQILTSDLIGTNGWTRIEQEFETTGETGLLLVTLRRIPSWKFDNKLRGSV
ncbi:MAG: tetratricopeptide repeat protein, partial [Acidobacteria bacterium]|nr:tetratricopeptide repeat protein [Acidobacteriota bacterium]